MLRARMFILLLVISLTVPLPALSSPRPAPNGKIPLYLMGPPTHERMLISAMSKIVEAEDLSKYQADMLRRSGAKLVFYDWIFARYEEDVNGWSTSSFLVRFDGPYGKALAYDYGNRSVREMRVRELVDRMKRENYTGVFFDWFPAACDPSIAEESAPGYVREFKRRHPDMSMAKALLSFLSELREEGRREGIDVLIISNQAYRCGPQIMASVDWDISESYFSDVKGNTTVLFPWEEGNWDSPATYVPKLVSSVYNEAREINFRLGFTHVSYALPGNTDAAFYSFAGAKALGQDGIAQAPSEVKGVVVRNGIPNAYWLGCLQYRINSTHWAIASYDLGIVGAGQVTVDAPAPIKGREVYDLRRGIIKRLLRMGRNGPWGDVFLRVPRRIGILACPSSRIEFPIWSNLTEGALESIKRSGVNCTLAIRSLQPEDGLQYFSLWKEAEKEVIILSNDIDWRISGVLLKRRLEAAGIRVFRAQINVEGVKEALLNSKVVIILGGPESPVTGRLMRPLTSKLAGLAGRHGPGRIVIWLWGRDRYGTREAALNQLKHVLREVENVLSPLPVCPSANAGLMRDRGG